MQTPFCLLLLIALILPPSLMAQKVPTFEEVLSLRSAGSIAISPDGRHVAYTVTTTDWKENRYDTEIWLSKNSGEPFPLTRTEKGNSTSPRWSPDGRWIAFLTKRGAEEQTQLYAIRTDGGEARPLTQVKGELQQFDWSPDGKHLAFTLTEAEDKTDKKRKDRFGAYAVDDEEFKLARLYVVGFDPYRPAPEEQPCYEENDSLRKINCLQWPEPTALTDSATYTVGSFDWSPDGKKIVFQKQPNPLINSSIDADIAVLDVASRRVTDLVTNPSYDGNPMWSPDGRYILYTSALENRTSYYYKNDRLFRIPAGGGATTELAADFDEDKYVVDWVPDGIYFIAHQGTDRALYRVDPSTGRVNAAISQPDFIRWAGFSRDGKQVVVIARGDQELDEVYFGGLNGERRKLTNFTAALAGWALPKDEVISWTSRDGARIEGVLSRPADYDPARKYPLLVIIHGGPTGISVPSPVPHSLYPALQWLAKGALILQPNYRGSAGYGEAFRSLNVRNLGVGDAWDVLAGVDHLDSLGLIDTTRLGAMGWSQGGYISAFLTTTSNRFKAISVGAGISNWMTYYVNTDIHPFTRQYLQSTPWEDPDVYARTSPMTYIRQASTPTLIQHGENDQRVPIPNAYELLQGLRDQNVPARLVVYKGFGHGINKPKERLAAAWHNWQWFNRYLWGEEVALPF